MSVANSQAAQETVVKKSLVEQIMDETVRLVSDLPEFDSTSINGLKKIIETGDIKKSQQVEKLLNYKPKEVE